MSHTCCGFRWGVSAMNNQLYRPTGRRFEYKISVWRWSEVFRRRGIARLAEARPCIEYILGFAETNLPAFFSFPNRRSSLSPRPTGPARRRHYQNYRRVPQPIRSVHDNEIKLGGFVLPFARRGLALNLKDEVCGFACVVRRISIKPSMPASEWLVVWRPCHSISQRWLL
jgi:hypothetical protein